MPPSPRYRCRLHDPDEVALHASVHITSIRHWSAASGAIQSDKRDSVASRLDRLPREEGNYLVVDRFHSIETNEVREVDQGKFRRYSRRSALMVAADSRCLDSQ